MRQEFLFSFSSEHGGTLTHGKRKRRRPLATKKPIHLVLKSRRNLLRNRLEIESLLARQSARFAIRIYDQAVAHDHVHLLLRIPGRREYTAFLRAFCGLLARKLGAGLWTLLPFSRVASWGREFRALRRYLQLNREEAAGLRPLRPKKKKRPPPPI